MLHYKGKSDAQETGSPPTECYIHCWAFDNDTHYIWQFFPCRTISCKKRGSLWNSSLSALRPDCKQGSTVALDPHLKFHYLSQRRIQSSATTCKRAIPIARKIFSARLCQIPGLPVGQFILPSKYYPGPTLISFRDQMRLGVLRVVWPQVGHFILKVICSPS